MDQPEELNLLNSVQYKLDIHNLPNTTYHVQSALLPTMTLEGGILPTMRREVPVPGRKLEFDTLTITYLVDQDLKNYEELYYWMLRIGTEEKFQDMISDLSLHFLTGNMNVSRTINFIGAYPSTLTELALQIDEGDSIPVVGTAIFNFQYFTFSNGNFPIKLD